MLPPKKGQFKSKSGYKIEVDTFSHNDEPRTDEGDYVGKVRAFKDEKEVGSASVYKLKGGKMRGEFLNVDPEHRKQGIASAMYGAVEKHHNTSMVPSPKQDEGGKAFWEKRKLGSFKEYLAESLLALTKPGKDEYDVFRGRHGEETGEKPKTGFNPTGDVHFFSSSPHHASTFASILTARNHNVEQGKYYEPGDGENVMPARITLKNPMKIDAKGKSFKKVETHALIADARAKGHDGVIIANHGEGFNSRLVKPATTYAVFDKGAIKSRFDSSNYKFNAGIKF